MCLSMTEDFLTSPSTTIICCTILMVDQFCASSSIHPRHWMRWIPSFSALMTSSNMVPSWRRISTCPSGTRHAQSNLCTCQEVLVCFWQQGCLCPSQEVRVCQWYWGCKAHCHQKDTLWAQGDPYHADCHCCPRESWPYTTDNRGTLVIQSVVGSQTTSGAHVWHWQVHLALLRQLYSAELCDQDNCLPYSTLWFGN